MITESLTEAVLREDGTDNRRGLEVRWYLNILNICIKMWSLCRLRIYQYNRWDFIRGKCQMPVYKELIISYNTHNVGYELFPAKGPYSSANGVEGRLRCPKIWTLQSFPIPLIWIQRYSTHAHQYMYVCNTVSSNQGFFSETSSPPTRGTLEYFLKWFIIRRISSIIP